MSAFPVQRWVGIFLLASFTTLGLSFHFQRGGLVPNYAYFTGWALFGLMVLLTAYNPRKKLPFLPLLTSEGWLRLHVYAGFFTVTLFLMHVNFRLPTGWFEGTLAWLYALVTGSGIGGLILTRALPKRLTVRGGEVFHERIPAVRRRLQEQVEALALGVIPESKSTILAEFYVRRLRDFLEGPQNFWLHLVDSRRPLNAVLADLNDLRRYLNDQELATLEKIAAFVRQKDGLDYHHALQTTLKLWLFVHVPLTYSLMIVAFVHIALVFAFSGGAR